VWKLSRAIFILKAAIMLDAKHWTSGRDWSMYSNDVAFVFDEVASWITYNLPPTTSSPQAENSFVGTAS